MVAVRLPDWVPSAEPSRLMSRLPLVTLVGLLKVWSRTWFGSSLPPPPPPPPQPASAAGRTSDEREDRDAGSDAGQVKLPFWSGLLRRHSVGRGRVADPPERVPDGVAGHARERPAAHVTRSHPARATECVSFVTWAEGLARAAAPRTPSGLASACRAGRRCRRPARPAATENPPGAKFCIECGTALGAADRRGGAPPGSAPQPPPPPGVAAPGARPPPSAAGCSAASSRASPRPPGARPRGALPEERRKATVLFADLSGYTAVAERMDPEAVKSIVDRALRRLGQEVVRYGGTRRQVHRRQRDGGVRRAGRPRGRPRARRPRRPRDAGRDGGDQQGHRRPPPASASRCGSGSTPARCWPARSATATR